MAKKRGATLSVLPVPLHPDQRLTARQGMQLSGRGQTQYYEDIKKGILPPPCEKRGRFVRWRAGDLLDKLTSQAEAE
jgi:predicted DNA-binding transcriptional regulator AlpA